MNYWYTQQHGCISKILCWEKEVRHKKVFTGYANCYKLTSMNAPYNYQIVSWCWSCFMEIIIDHPIQWRPSLLILFIAFIIICNYIFIYWLPCWSPVSILDYNFQEDSSYMFFVCHSLPDGFYNAQYQENCL